MNQSVFYHIWFWFTVIGIALILGTVLAYIINEKRETWITVIFWVGVGLGLLGLLIGISLFLINDCFNYHINEEKEIVVISKDIIDSPYTPARTEVNLPQLSRGFVPTGDKLSSLNPNFQSLGSPIPSPYTSLNRMFV